MATSEPNQVDSITGQTTTGHEWDGIRELNTPLPRWWLWTFYATILFSVVYWVLYPAWPLVSSLLAWRVGILLARSGRRGRRRRSRRSALRPKQASTRRASRRSWPTRSCSGLAFAHGKAAFAEDCAPCHGSGGQGSKGYRNLTNEDWLWGGTLDDIQTTITHGIRADYDKDTRSSAMPAFGRDGILKPEEIHQVASYVRTLSKLEPEAGVDVAAGKKIFADNCAVCHGDDGKGNLAMGSANLTDGLQLYGGDFKDLIQTITYARNSTMPAWGARLDPVTIKSLAVYVHSLGAGQ